MVQALAWSAMPFKMEPSKVFVTGFFLFGMFLGVIWPIVKTHKNLQHE